MNKFLQTILFFVLAGAMIAFIFSALRPAQYLAESEFLVISNNVESSCNKKIGGILARVIVSESFREDLIKSINVKKEEKFDLIKNVKIKNYKNSNIVNVQTKGVSLASTQQLAESIERTILFQSYKYYAPQDRINIQALISSRIIRTPKTILENTIIGFAVGGLVGLMVVLLTDLRLNILAKKQQVTISRKKVKTKKTKYDSITNNDYTTIIKKRLEKELSKKPIKDLALTDERYVFKKRNTRFQKVLEKEDELQTTFKKEKSIEKIKTEDTHSTAKPIAKARVISASTMIVGKHNKEIKEDKVPENLPVFIDEKFLEDNTKKQIAPKEIVKNDQSGAEDKIKMFTELQEVSPMKKSSTKEFEVDTKNEKTGVPSGLKKASAHDIANGFAPDMKNEGGPSNEEIKDRLNRLLRGEL